MLLTLRVISLLPTAALLSLDLLLAINSRHDLTLWSSSMASAVLTAIILAEFLALLAVNSSRLLERLTTRTLQSLLASIALVGLGTAAASVAVAVSVSRVSEKGKSIIIDGTANKTLLITYSAVLGVSFLCQLGLMATFAAKLRHHSTPSVGSVSTDTESQPSLKTPWRVKAIPYSSTRPSIADTRGVTSFESTCMTSIRRCTSPAPTCDSTRSSSSHTTHRTPSKRRLLSLRETPQLAPFDGESVRASSDTYADSLADDHPRWYQTLEAHTLETIPASPLVESGFARLTGLTPPLPARQRSRSYSPMGTRLPPPIPDVDSRRDSTDELHIHPLFRSDSPTPPPMATPGTIVTASPDAGRVIRHAKSSQSLRRLRSGSLPAQSSPLSRMNSSDTSAPVKVREACRSICEEGEVQRGRSS